ncbi:MAG: hypothetical protein IMZ65_03540 [Planctomycetes bacterium]|nr:hypothetical protein [Planctomycetota bacterium]
MKPDRIEEIARILVQDVHDLSWDRTRGTSAMRGRLGRRRQRALLAVRGGLCVFRCLNIVDANPRVLSELTSQMTGPARLELAQRSGSSSFAASWPLDLVANGTARAVASDLAWVRTGSPRLPRVVPLTTEVRQRLKDAVAADGRVVEVAANGQTWDFIVPQGPASMQVCAWQPTETLVAFTSLVTNCPGPDGAGHRAFARLACVLNGRLRWVRLARRGTAIEAQVIVPAEAISPSLWKLARQALSAAITWGRPLLRIVQDPSVLAFRRF